ncbi:MAG: DNA gyrase subunit A [Prevotellaceae bacterium]|jgi:DNA gyrase subunit A|nr:DNA gyrase subunit A [Prevotellaceae bacterium]
MAEIEDERIVPVNIEEIMKSSYIDYSMSVIVSRALPDVRDGLKPVHRRVLYGMSELGLSSTSAHKKSARIVGEVMGKYHPHGDSSVYYTMVRMAQWWSLRYMMVDGQGNFGSRDGDAVAAMRYTEARLRKIAEEMLLDIDKNTVDLTPNFDDSLTEPSVLPSKIPMLLVNGSSGIAVGMATNMPPHNLGEAVNAICAYIDNNDIATDELMQHIKGPDFPTGGIIYGVQGIKEAYETGRGRVVIRARTEIEISDTGRETIVVTELPYMVSPAALVEKIAHLVEEKIIDGISYVNDESDRVNLTRVVIKLRKDAVANIVINHLFRHTDMQSSFSINSIALVDGRPRLLSLKEQIKYFVRHRHEVVVRRAKFDLGKAEDRLHILEGLLKAIDHIDEVIATIRASKTPDEAIQQLMLRFELDDLQARAIVDMRLRALTGLERDKLQAEFDELTKLVADLKIFLGSEELQMNLIKEELTDVKTRFDDGRKTEIVPAAEEFNPEDFYADDEVVITISHLGYIKRTPLNDYHTQNRGGVGAKGAVARDEDFIEHIFAATMHNTMLFFTKKGKCYWLKVYEIPEGTRTTKGRAIQNIVNLEPDDKVKAYINVKTLEDKEYIDNNHIVLCTKRGIIKKTVLEQYSRPRQNGVIAINVKDGDQLLEAKLTNGSNEIILAARHGKALRFNESKVRSIGRTASGVRGMFIDGTDEVVGMVCVSDEKSEILVVSENGYGKRSALSAYRVTNRGGKGVKTLSITEKTGSLIAIKDVTDENDLMIINRSGITIRVPVSEIRMSGRVAQGVKLIKLRDSDAIAAVAKVNKSEEEEYAATPAEATPNETPVETPVETKPDENLQQESAPVA